MIIMKILYVVVGVSVAPAEICEINDAVMCQNCTALQSGFSERRGGVGKLGGVSDIAL